MGECLLEANGLNNDYDFPYDNYHGRPKGKSTDEIRPPKSTLAGLVEWLCKWFGANPLDNRKDIDITYGSLLNRTVPSPSVEELNWRRNNEPADEHISRRSSDLWHESIEGPIAPPRNQTTYESSLNNMRWVDSEPPTLSNEQEGCTSSSQHNSPSKEPYRKMSPTTMWSTPPDRLIIEPRGRSEYDCSFQSLSYFTAATCLSTMEFEIEESTTDYEYEDDESAIGHKESTHEIETRIMAALCKYKINEIGIRRCDEEWWMNDDGSCNSADLSSIHTMDTNDHWNEDETNAIPNGYKYKTIDQLFQQISQKSNETDTNEEVEHITITENTEELYQDETIDKFCHQECVGEEECNSTQAEPTVTTTDNKVEAIDEIDKLYHYETWEVEPKIVEIDEQTEYIIGMRRLIIRCNTQQLLPWTNIIATHGDECNRIKYEQTHEYINGLGYGHYITKLICSRLYMVQMICIAIELQALLRRCSYPKRDVIRWNMLNEGGICPWKLSQLI